MATSHVPRCPSGVRSPRPRGRSRSTPAAAAHTHKSLRCSFALSQVQAYLWFVLDVLGERRRGEIAHDFEHAGAVGLVSALCGIARVRIRSILLKASRTPSRLEGCTLPARPCPGGPAPNTTQLAQSSRITARNTNLAHCVDARQHKQRRARVVQRADDSGAAHTRDTRHTHASAETRKRHLRCARRARPSSASETAASADSSSAPAQQARESLAVLGITVYTTNDCHSDCGAVVPANQQTMVDTQTNDTRTKHIRGRVHRKTWTNQDQQVT